MSDAVISVFVNLGLLAVFVYIGSWIMLYLDKFVSWGFYKLYWVLTNFVDSRVDNLNGKERARWEQQFKDYENKDKS